MPRLLLLDEPLGALDLQLRKDMQLELKNIQKQANITFLYVTHDQEEALTMSDVIVVMKSGTIQQIGTPQDIYNEPANAFVADFVGESNILNGIMEQDYQVTIGNASLPCVDGRPDQRPEVDVVIRPEDVELVPPELGFTTGVVESSLFKGVHYEMTVNVDSMIWLVHSTVSAVVGERVGLRITPDNVHIMKKMYPQNVNTMICEVQSVDEDGVVELRIEGCKYHVSTPVKCQPGDRVQLQLPPDCFSFVSIDEGDFTVYLDSIIWKADHYELLLDGEEGRYLAYKSNDEQAGSELGVTLDLSKATLTFYAEGGVGE